MCRVHLLATALVAVAVLASGCGNSNQGGGAPTGPVAKVDGEPVLFPDYPSEPDSPEEKLWRDTVFVKLRIVGPFHVRLIEAEGIRVTQEDLEAAGMKDGPELSDKSRKIMQDAMLAGAINGLRIRIEQSPPGNDRAKLVMRLAKLEAAKERTDATPEERLDALGPEAQEMAKAAGRRLAEAPILAWKADKAIHERYAKGRVVRRVDPRNPDVSYTIPLDAYRAWLTELEKQGAWSLYDNFRKQFNAVLEVQPTDTLLDHPEEYFAHPPKMDEQAASDADPTDP